MSDDLLDMDYDVYEEPSARTSRPSLAQVRALLDFLQRHPDLAHRKLRSGVTQQKVKKLWTEAANICNSLEGALKSSQGWIKFWSDKRRSVMLKRKQIDEGTLDDALSPIEEDIYELCQNIPKPSTKKKKRVAQYNGNDNAIKEEVLQDTEELELSRLSTDSDERQLGIMEKLVEVMDQQAQAMSQMAQAAHTNSKAIERLADASHMQALAVDRLATTFESIGSSVLDMRNSILNIDYTLKSYPSAVVAAAPTTTQHTQNNLFS